MFRVLIVDDEYLMREALEIMISRFPEFKVAASVGSGEEAVEICKTDDIDIVFMDIVMPGMSGIEAGKKIKRLNSDMDVYIISGYSNFELAKEALKANVKEYISKPISFSIIENLLSGYRKNNVDESDYAMELLKVIDEKDFSKAYHRAPEIVRSIYYDEAKSMTEIKNIFITIAQKILKTVGFREKTPQMLNELFPYDDHLFSDVSRIEYWMLEIVNYIFEKLGIRKYEVLEEIFSYINENIKNRIGLNEIVDHCAISQGYLSRIFKNHFNVSVMEYIHMRKLIIAKTYLADGTGIADTAFLLGYSESSYFSKVFKKYEKMTVFQYRKSLNKKAGDTL